MTILGCTGHQAIPPQAEGHVLAGLADVISGHSQDSLVGVCSLAVGADQLFARAVLGAGGELRVVVPSDNYESTFDGKDLDAYRHLLAQAAAVDRLPFPEPSEEAFFAAGTEVAAICEVLVAVWDGAPAKGRGGTADVVSHARQLGRTVTIIWPKGVTRD